MNRHWAGVQHWFKENTSLGDANTLRRRKSHTTLGISLNPPAHPLFIDLLRLLNKSQFQQQLDGPPNRRMQSGTDPSLRGSSVLADENSIVLRGVVRGNVQFVLLHVRATPARCCMFLWIISVKGALKGGRAL